MAVNTYDMNTNLIFIGILVVAIIFVVSIYNNLVKLRNRFKNAFSQIDVQLKRRHDLIPNLVETAKGYMSHEKSTLEAVIQARNMAEGARTKVSQNPADKDAMKNLVQAEGQLGGVLGRLFALSENYPDLKANQNMLQIQEELTSTENKVAFARQAYNDSVLEYNNAREVFPNVIFAGIFNFQAGTPYEIENVEEKKAPQVKFT